MSSVSTGLRLSRRTFSYAIGVMSFLSRKWKRSSFDSVALNIRTATLTRPKEIVPLQIGRAMTAVYPALRCPKTVPCLDALQGGYVLVTKLLHLTGG